MKIPKEYLGAFKKGHRVSAREFIDEQFSYELLLKIKNSQHTDQEAINQLKYITKFNNEFHKNVVKKGSETDLHNTDELRRDCYKRENSRNRDISSAYASELVRLPEQINKDFRHHEETLIAIIDENRKINTYY